MTAYRDVFLGCNHPKCGKEFRAEPEFGFPPVNVVRREARKAGWTIQRSSLGRSFDKDYCPAHPDGKDADDGR